MTRSEDRKMILHVFIQWLTSEGILNDWMDEIMNETDLTRENNWTFETRAARLQNTTNYVRLITTSFGTMRSIKGAPFWREHDIKWGRVANKLIKSMRQTRLDKEYGS